MNKRIIIILLAIFLISGCGSTNVEDSSIKDIMSEANIQCSTILYKEDIEDGILLFYETVDQEGLNVGFLRKSFLGLKWVTGAGVAEINPNKGLSWAWSRIDQKVSYFYGIVKDPNIVKIQVKDSNGKTEVARFVKTESDVVIWLLKRSNDYRGEITGLSKDGKVLYEY